MTWRWAASAPRAAATAASDVADYRLTSEERFRDMMTPAKAIRRAVAARCRSPRGRG